MNAQTTTSRILTASLLSLAALGVSTGCDNSPPPPRVPVPAQGTLGPPRYDYAKPLPGQVPQQPAPQYQQTVPPPPPPSSPYGYNPPPPSVAVEATPSNTNVQVQVPAPQYAPPPPPPAQPGYDPRIAAPPANQVALPPPPPQPAPGAYDDQPILRDRPPEQRAFVDAYNRVGRPKIAIYINRNLDGNIIPPSINDPQPAVRVDRNVNWNYQQGTASDRIDVYLKPGQYDEAYARSLDYEAIENTLTDWLAANGQTEVISPTLARARLTEEQRNALDKGERFVLTDITQRLDADIFIQVQARPTRQTPNGLEIRLVSEALNTRGGRSIARAVVDVPPPLQKTTINEYTRFLARKLMDDMITTWSAPMPAGANAAPPQAAPPAPSGATRP